MRTRLRRIFLGTGIFSLVSLGVLGAPASADGPWTTLGTGANSFVEAVVGDGAGNVYAAGGFGQAGGVPVFRVAKWDGTNWSALGSGLQNTGYSLTFDSSGNLYVGGAFTAAGGVSANRVAKWDGTNWSALGSGLDNSAFTLAFDTSGNLYAGGTFTTAGGVSANRVAKWDGGSWSALSSGANGAVYALAVDTSGNLYAGGDFTTIGGVSANNVAKWDGSNWSALGTGMSGGSDTVRDLVFDDSGNLYASGDFSTAGGVTVNNVAKWDGTNWSALGSGANDVIYGLTVDSSGTLFAGGSFTSIGGVSANRVAEWDGSSWSALGSGANTSVFSLTVEGGDLFAGGDFTTMGGVSANRIASWTLPTTPSPVGSSSGQATYFTYLLPDGRECTSISPQRVEVGTFVELPGTDALCKTMSGSTVAGWTIPVPPNFTGYGSAANPFPPGLKVKVIESQRFTLVPLEPILQIDYDANIAAADPCAPANLADTSNDGRVSFTWVPREIFAEARSPRQAPCVPNGYELISWNTFGNGSGASIEPGAPLPDSWAEATSNHYRLYAQWRAIPPSN